MPWSVLSLITLIAASSATGARPPSRPRVQALFNGKDLTGWHGMPHFDPYKLAMMRTSERKAKIDAWTADAKKHWTVEKGELVNDGNGAYLTTDEDYGDIELLLEYKTVPKADSGIYLRATPQVQIWDYTKEGGKWNLGADKGSAACGTTAKGSPGKDPLVLADKPFGEWNTFRILMVGERVTVYLNDKLVVDHARLENFWKNKLAEPLMRKAPDPASDPRRRDPLAQHVHPRDPQRRGQRDPPQARQQGLRGRLQRQGLHRLGRPDRSV